MLGIILYAREQHREHQEPEEEATDRILIPEAEWLLAVLYVSSKTITSREGNVVWNAHQLQI